MLHGSQAVALLLFEETRGISDPDAQGPIKAFPSEAEVLGSTNSVSLFGQQKERRPLNQELLGGSKLCLAEADEEKSQDGSGRDTNPAENLGHLITDLRRGGRPSALLEEGGQQLPLRRKTCSVLGLTEAIPLCLRDCLIKKNAAPSHFNCFSIHCCKQHLK